jgi:hypothetical protein
MTTRAGIACPTRPTGRRRSTRSRSSTDGLAEPAERERLERFPVEIALEDLRESFTLKAGDRDLVFSQHGPARLGVAGGVVRAALHGVRSGRSRVDPRSRAVVSVRPSRGSSRRPARRKASRSRRPLAGRRRPTMPPITGCPERSLGRSPRTPRPTRSRSSPSCWSAGAR